MKYVHCKEYTIRGASVRLVCLHKQDTMALVKLLTGHGYLSVPKTELKEAQHEP